MLDQNLVNAIPLMGQIQTIIATKMSLLPASGAMAGVYSYIDSTRGVWNAPANVTLNSVLRPNVNINGDLQGPLNAPIGGKSVNVIREFVGRGPVVWGARTLDGNSLDWRYIQVRRTSVYIEQSIKTALNQFVFAANNGSTWVAVTAMVSNFLQNLWSQGGLMGDKASEAFTVQCGKGSTMTDLDILEGYMIVQVTLQMIHPAEFIELTFKQRMGAMG
jgi:Bacteriophage tail sheath protein